MKVTPSPSGRLADPGWLIHHPRFSPLLKQAIRKVPGMHWDDQWRGVGYLDAVVTVVDHLREKGLRVDDSALSRDGGHHIDYIGLDKRLRPYQVEAVSFLLSHPEAILADQMGLGKTASALFAAHNAPGAHTLVVCPSYVRPNWEAEIAKWLGPRQLALPSGVKKIEPIGDSAEYVIIHYDILSAWAPALIEWDPQIVIFDEAHIGQNANSQRGKAMRAVSSGARYRWALTGTPLTNRVIDLWNIVDTISPGRFGSFPHFGIRYCAGHQEEVLPGKTVWKFGGKSHEPELAKRLRYFTLRRTASDVALQLPPRTRQIIPIGIKSVGLPPGAGAAFARRALDIAADQKLPAASELAIDHLRSGAKIVLFCWRRAVAETLAETLVGAGLSTHVIHGGVGHGVRGKRIDNWRQEPGASALVATIDCCATGIDLTAASIAVFVELTWEPHELLQAEARVYRFGASLPVLIQYLIATGSADEVISARVVEKLGTFEDLLGKSDDQLRGDLDGSATGSIFDELNAWAAKRRKK